MVVSHVNQPLQLPGPSAAAVAIERLLTEYKAAPLKYLREINLQVRLGNLLEEELTKRDETLETMAVVSRNGDGVARVVQSETPTHRLQHEMKIRPGKGRAKEKSDIVLLKAQPLVHLTRECNGTLDVIATVPIQSIEVVIEIKAACSYDPEQRHLFRQDAIKLRTLREAAPTAALETHFVLIDKSLPIEPHTLAFGPPPVHEWERGSPGVLVLRRKSDQVIDIQSPQLTLVPPTNVNQAGVHVWDLGPNLTVRHRVLEGTKSLTEQQALGLGVVKKAKRSDSK